MIEVNIPGSVTRIDCEAFQGCTKLSAINVDTENKVYSSLNGVLFDKARTSLMLYPTGNTATLYDIPNTVTSISKYAFTNCANLKSINIPDSVKIIGRYAFYSSKSLARVTILGDLTIDTCAFTYCEKLARVTIADSVKYIADGAFSYCPKLKIITNPGTYADEYAKSNNIATIYIYMLHLFQQVMFPNFQSLSWEH